VGHGLAEIAIARRLAKVMKRVCIFTEWQEGLSTINKAIIGDGFDDIERVDEIWDVYNETDLFVFPDIQHSGLQLFLESQGKAVWGSRKADRYEWDRELFLDTLGQLGMDVPAHTVITGVTNLRLFLEDKEDYYLKISKYRGSMETCHYRNYRLDSGLLDSLAVRWGSVKEHMRVLCFPAIDTTLEIGGDTYCIDGEFPNVMLHGIEWKDKCYLGSVTKREDMPPQITHIMDEWWPVLGADRYRNQFSMEDRVVSDSEHYFIDATCRFGLPSTGSQLNAWRNWPDIVWYGANGLLLQPEPACKYTAEAMVKLCGETGEWREVEMDKEMLDFFVPADCCMVDGKLCWPASDSGGSEEVGWLIAIGNSPKETIEAMNKLADGLPDGMDANTECLAYVLKEIQEEEEKGIEFGKQEVPEPAIVMND
jgi:hypothetical protein